MTLKTSFKCVSYILLTYSKEHAPSWQVLFHVSIQDLVGFGSWPGCRHALSRSSTVNIHLPREVESAKFFLSLRRIRTRVDSVVIMESLETWLNIDI